MCVLTLLFYMWGGCCGFVCFVVVVVFGVGFFVGFFFVVVDFLLFSFSF